jgi:hypothetical protein
MAPFRKREQVYMRCHHLGSSSGDDVMRIATARVLKLVGLAALVAAGWLIGAGAGKLPGSDRSIVANEYLADFPRDIGPTRPGPTDPNGPLH